MPSQTRCRYCHLCAKQQPRRRVEIEVVYIAEPEKQRTCTRCGGAYEFVRDDDRSRIAR